MSTVVITADGVDITADVIFSDARFMSSARGAPGTASFRIKDLAHEYAVGIGKELTLDVDGVRVWGGYIMSVHRAYFFDAYDCRCKVHLVPRYHLVEAVDYNVLLNRRVLYDKDTPEKMELTRFPADTPDSVVVKYYVDNHTDLGLDGVGTSKVETVGAPSLDDFISGTAGWSMTDFMSLVTRNTGAVYYLDPDKELVLTDVETANAPKGISDRPNEFEVGCRDLEILFNGSNLRNDAMVWGAGQGDDEVVFSRVRDATSIAEHYIWQVGEFSTGMFRQATVDRVANSYVYGSPQNQRGGKDDAPTVRCTVFSPIFRVAQKVEVRSDIFGFNEVLPIRSIDISFPTPTDPQFDLVISQEIDDPWHTFEFWFPDFDYDVNIPEIDIPEIELPPIEDGCLPIAGELPHVSAFSTWTGPPFEFVGRFRFHMADASKIHEARFVLKSRDSDHWDFVPGQIGIFSNPGIQISFTNDVNAALGCTGADALTFGMRIHDQNEAAIANSWLNIINPINDEWISFRVRAERWGMLGKVWKDLGVPDITEPADWQYAISNFDTTAFDFTDPVWLDTFEIGLSGGGTSSCAFVQGARIEVDYVRMVEGWYTGELPIDNFDRVVVTGMGLSQVPELQAEGEREAWVVSVPVSTDVSVQDQAPSVGRLVYEPTDVWASGGPPNSFNTATLEAIVHIPYNTCPQVDRPRSEVCEDAVRINPPPNRPTDRAYYKVSHQIHPNTSKVWVEGIRISPGDYSEGAFEGLIEIYADVIDPLISAGINPVVHVCYYPGEFLYAEG